MLLLEVRDLRTNDLLTSYDVTDTADQPGVVRAATAAMPDGACVITVERDSPLGDLTATPDPLAEPLPEPAPADPTDPTDPAVGA